MTSVSRCWKTSSSGSIAGVGGHAKTTSPRHSCSRRVAATQTHHEIKPRPAQSPAASEHPGVAAAAKGTQSRSRSSIPSRDWLAHATRQPAAVRLGYSTKPWSTRRRHLDAAGNAGRGSTIVVAVVSVIVTTVVGNSASPSDRDPYDHIHSSKSLRVREVIQSQRYKMRRPRRVRAI